MIDPRRLCCVLAAAILAACAGGPVARAQSLDALDAGVDSLALSAFVPVPGAVVAGRVTARGRALVGASVLVPGTLAAAVTDATGAFTLDIDAAPGDGTGDAATFTVRIDVRFAGYRAERRRVALTPGDTLRLDVDLDRLPFWARLRVFGEPRRFGTTARETFGTARRVAAEPTVGAADAASGVADGPRTDAPARTVGALVGLAPSVVRDDRTDSLSVRGALLPFVLDGIALPHGTALPLGLVEALEVLPGAFPASMASGAGGAVAVTSRRGDAARRLRIDARGAAFVGDGFAPARPVEVGGRAEGAFARDRVRIAAGLRTVSTDDPSPSARPLPRLAPGALARLRAMPQTITYTGADGREATMALPVALPGTRVRDLLPPGARIDGDLRLSDAAGQISDDDLTRTSVRPGADARTDEGFARVGLALPFGVGLDLLRTSVRADAGQPMTATSLFTPGDARARATARHTRTRLTARRLGTDLAVTVARTNLGRTVYRDGFGRDVRATLAYSDIDDPRNATAAAYRTLRLRSSSLPLDSTVLVSRYSDRALPSSRGVFSVFALPGAVTTGYARTETRETTARADATRRFGGASGRAHTATAGIDHTRTTDRAFGVSVAATQAFAQRFDDGLVDFGGRGVTRYDDLPASALLYRVRAVGFSFNGLRHLDGDGGADDLTAYAACIARIESCTGGQKEAPARAMRTGAWIADRLVAGPLALDVGVRVDLFARGGLALRDPYALLPVESARSAGLAGGAIDGDWVPYFNGDAVAGFRDRQGRFYDRAGQAVDEKLVLQNVSVKPRRLGDPAAPMVLDARAFRAPLRHMAWQPRVAASLALGADASLFAAVTTTAEAVPSALAHAAFDDYQRILTSWSDAPNADLAPVRATIVSGGGRVATGALALSVEGWMRRARGLPESVIRFRAFPGPYETLESSGQRRAIGADVAAEVAARPGLRLSAAYSVEAERGRVLFLRPAIESYAPGTTVFRANLVRHRVLTRLRGATARNAGPSVGSFHPLGRWTLDAAYDVASGAPYARLEARYPITSPSLLPGARSAARMPATHRVDLAATRELGRAAGGRVALTIRGENVLGRWNVRRVYGATGLPDEDGYAQTSNGRLTLGEGTDAARLYRLRLLDDRAYGVARQVEIGLRWTR